MGMSIGALWTNKSPKGLEYYSGNVKLPRDMKQGEKLKIVVFANDKKKEENHPDYNILESTPKRQG